MVLKKNRLWVSPPGVSRIPTGQLRLVPKRPLTECPRLFPSASVFGWSTGYAAFAKQHYLHFLWLTLNTVTMEESQGLGPSPTTYGQRDFREVTSLG